MDVQELNVKDKQYKDKFISTIVETAKVVPNDMGIVYAEYDAHVESVGENHVGDPVFDAKECVSYWTE